MNFVNTFKTLQNIEINGTNYSYFDLNLISHKFNFDIKQVPSSIKILLENLLRNEDGEIINASTIENSSSKDMLFEVLMARFDILNIYIIYYFG